MKLITLIFTLVTILTSCNASAQTNNNDLKIPDKVEIKKEGKHERVSGTKIFIVPPKDYIFDPTLFRYQKNNETYINVLELYGGKYTEKKAILNETWDNLKSLGVMPEYEKEFKLGKYDALLIYSKFLENSDDINLFFGDDNFTVMLMASFPKNDNQARQEILSALLTAYLDKDVQIDYVDLAKFTIDVSKSEFKLYSNVSQMFYYTTNGKAPTSGAENLIIIHTAPPQRDFQEVKNFAKDVIEDTKKNINVLTVEENEIEINNIKSYEMIITSALETYYMVVINSDKVALMFRGRAVNRHDELLRQFKEVSQTIRLK
ncbi:MAG TPA: hypothetical protein PLP27_09720 [Crocinitomicaceae bacterium]|nr:hypothetical protein [Crocinitomicaceae bacterium]